MIELTHEVLDEIERNYRDYKGRKRTGNLKIEQVDSLIAAARENADLKRRLAECEDKIESLTKLLQGAEYYIKPLAQNQLLRANIAAALSTKGTKRMTDQDKTDLDRRAAEVLGIYVVCDQFGRPWACVGDAVSLWHPTESRDQAALLEAEAVKRGRGEQYVYRLTNEWCLARQDIPREDWSWRFNLWLATAPAEARVRAALAVLEPEAKSDA